MVNLFGKSRTYTADKNLIGRCGLYSPQEWAHNRFSIEPFVREPTERGYRLSVYQDLDKTSCAKELVRRFDFSSFRRLGDIGGIPFLQARVILDHHPELAATLTDYDGESLAVLQRMTVFLSDRPRSFARLDVEENDLSSLDDCDILTMWAVDYALSDEALSKVFRHVARTNSTLLLATIHVSSFGVAIKNLKGGIYRLLGEGRVKRRFHGWLRSTSYLDALAAKAECVTKAHLFIGRYCVHVIVPR